MAIYYAWASLLLHLSCRLLLRVFSSQHSVHFCSFLYFVFIIEQNVKWTSRKNTFLLNNLVWNSMPTVGDLCVHTHFSSCSEQSTSNELKRWNLRTYGGAKTHSLDSMLIEKQRLMVITSMPPAVSRFPKNRFVTETIKHFNGFSAELTAA